jgi:hypothetical protein
MSECSKYGAGKPACRAIGKRPSMPFRDSIAGLTAFVFAAGIFIMAGSYPPSTALFPRAVALFMMVAAGLLTVRGFFRSSPHDPLPRKTLLLIAAVILLTLVYIVCVDYLGFITSSLVFIPVTAYLLGARNLLLMAVTAVIFISAIAFLFKIVFGVPLPPEYISRLFG